MKTLIISDVHSNIAALEAIWQLESDSDQVVCAGDIVDYGPDPTACIDWLVDHRALCVKGNHDSHVINVIDGRTEAEEGSWALHNAAKIDDSRLDWLRKLPDTKCFWHDQQVYGLTHRYKKGYEIIRSLYHQSEFIRKRFDIKLSWLVMGHTHRREIHYLDNNIGWINPGSTSYRRPDDPDRSAHYAVLTGRHCELRRCLYNLEPLEKSIDRCGITGSYREVAMRFWGNCQKDSTVR